MAVMTTGCKVIESNNYTPYCKSLTPVRKYLVLWGVPENEVTSNTTGSENRKLNDVYPLTFQESKQVWRIVQRLATLLLLTFQWNLDPLTSETTLVSLLKAVDSFVFITGIDLRSKKTLQVPSMNEKQKRLRQRLMLQLYHPRATMRTRILRRMPLKVRLQSWTTWTLVVVWCQSTQRKQTGSWKCTQETSGSIQRETGWLGVVSSKEYEFPLWVVSAWHRNILLTWQCYTHLDSTVYSYIVTL